MFSKNASHCFVLLALISALTLIVTTLSKNKCVCVNIEKQKLPPMFFAVSRDPDYNYVNFCD